MLREIFGKRRLLALAVRALVLTLHIQIAGARKVIYFLCDLDVLMCIWRGRAGDLVLKWGRCSLDYFRHIKSVLHHGAKQVVSTAVFLRQRMRMSVNQHLAPLTAHFSRTDLVIYRLCRDKELTEFVKYIVFGRISGKPCLESANFHNLCLAFHLIFEVSLAKINNLRAFTRFDVRTRGSFFLTCRRHCDIRFLRWSL